MIFLPKSNTSSGIFIDTLSPAQTILSDKELVGIVRVRIRLQCDLTGAPIAVDEGVWTGQTILKWIAPDVLG